MVKLNDLTLRDAHQSLLATRLKTEDMIPVLELFDKAGFYALEMWGGATFDAPLRYLKEDPWERLRIIRANIRRPKLMMLLRGQNLVGYHHYPDDIVEKFVEKAYENGIDIFRIFDALNDYRNLITSVRTAKRVGAEVQICIVYTISPVHTLEYYRKLAEEAKALDADTITIKDMAGILEPYTAYELVKMIKNEVGLPVNVHSHATAGFGPITLIKAAEAGADLLDVAVSTMSMATSHPPAETIAYILKKKGMDPGVDINIVLKIAEYFWEVRKKYRKYDYIYKGPVVDARVIIHQIPGGMLSNLISQLEQYKALDKLEQVLEEVPRVREDLGWPPLVTPLSQIVGTQAVMNIILGERYKIIIKEVKDYVKGLYGRPPAPIKEWLVKKVLGDEKPIDVRPADLLEPMYEKIKKELPRDLVEKEEDYLTYALFPEEALEFFKYRKELREKALKEYNVRIGKKTITATIEETGEDSYSVKIGDQVFNLELIED